MTTVTKATLVLIPKGKTLEAKQTHIILVKLKCTNAISAHKTEHNRSLLTLGYYRKCVFSSYISLLYLNGQTQMAKNHTPTTQLSYHNP